MTHQLENDAPTTTDNRSRALTALMWGVLAIAVLTNAVASFTDASLTVHLTLGLVSALAVAGLTVVQLRSRA